MIYYNRLALHKEKVYKCIMFLFIVLILYSWIPRNMKGIIGFLTVITIENKNNDTNTQYILKRFNNVPKLIMKKQTYSILSKTHWLCVTNKSISTHKDKQNQDHRIQDHSRQYFKNMHKRKPISGLHSSWAYFDVQKIFAGRKTQGEE